ncbi:NUDIX hydrolase [Natrialba sp. SSL1]|uniref:NUDIX hydrolase n=1 Tax=Natrialba sp. SSL1 TaxID=1869245 RepID=UPI0008F8BD9D|nr:NUDIX hydrolase [Natrialba sp. SSL1]OIB58151.1 NUDIX hydrolase [Natrialba sp. SSL1]
MLGDEFDGVPREQQTIRLSADRFESFRDWAVNGTACTAAARVCDRNGRIALVSNRWSDGWVLPGGAVEPDETVREATHREIREETGLDATIHEPLVVVEQTYRSASTDETYSGTYVVFAASADGSLPNIEELGTTPGEITAASWFETLPADLHDGALLRPYLSEYEGL